ncbi:MAG: nucleotidyltransferase domain-containing protein [Pyrobaculum sp.]
MEVFKWREELKRRAWEAAERVAASVEGTVLLVGSYARGDYGEDSDIDVLVVGRFSEPPHRRLPGLKTPPGVEVIALNLEEALKVVEKCYPLALDIALGVVIKDDLGVAQQLISTAKHCAVQKRL